MSYSVSDIKDLEPPSTVTKFLREDVEVAIVESGVVVLVIVATKYGYVEG